MYYNQGKGCYQKHYTMKKLEIELSKVWLQSKKNNVKARWF